MTENKTIAEAARFVKQMYEMYVPCAGEHLKLDALITAAQEAEGLKSENQRLKQLLEVREKTS